MTVLPVASMTVAPAGTRDRVGRTDGGDALAFDDDRRPRPDDAALAVEHVAVTNHERLRRRRR